MSDGPDPLPRLSRPRERLRVRLTCRGLALPATLLAPGAAVATMPVAMLDATIRASLGRPFRVVHFSCRDCGDPIRLCPRSKGREHTGLVQDLDLAESYLAQQVELVHQRPGRVFPGDVGEDGVAIGLVLQPDEVLAVAPSHHLLDRGGGVLDQVGNPDRAAGLERLEELREDGLPFRGGSEVVQHRRGHDDVEAGFAEVQVTDVALESLYVSFRRRPEALLGTFEHRPA